MDIRLKHIEIIPGHPYFDLSYRDESFKVKFEEDVCKRMDKRLHQIDCLKKLRDKSISDEEYYDLVTEVYSFSYGENYIINTNVLTGFDLTLLLKVNSLNRLDNNKFYSLSEIQDIFDSEEVLLSETIISEYDYTYYKKVYGVTRKDFVRVSNEDIERIHSSINDKNDIKQTKNEKIIIRLKELLTDERIDVDLKYLIDLTNYDFINLNNMDQDIIIRSLTY